MGFFGDLRQDLSQAVSELMPSDSRAEEMASGPEQTASLSLDEMLRNIDAIQLSEEDTRAIAEETPKVEEPTEEPMTLESVDIASMLDDIQAREEAYAAELNLEEMEAVFPEVDVVEDGQPESASAESLTLEEPIFAEATPEEAVFAESAPEEAAMPEEPAEEAAMPEQLAEEAAMPETAAEQIIPEGTVLWETEEAALTAQQEAEAASAESLTPEEPIFAESTPEEAAMPETAAEQIIPEGTGLWETEESALAAEQEQESASAESLTPEEPIFAEATPEAAIFAESASEEAAMPGQPAEEAAMPETAAEQIIPEGAGLWETEEAALAAEQEPTALEDISKQPDEGFTENSMKEENRMFEEKTEMQPAEEAVFEETMVGDAAGDAVQGLSDEAVNNNNEEEKGAEDIMDTYSTREALDETSVITSGMTITGDVTSEGSIDIVGNVNGNISALGKLNITGHINGNSKASEVYAEGAKINGEIVSEGAVKIGASTVIIGNISAVSAAIAGAVKGDIDVRGPVVLDASAIVMGNIKSKSVQINNGAVIEGMCSQCYADVSPTAFFEDYKPEKKKSSK